MRDVWTTKNPYMSQWLSAANQMTYAASGPFRAEAKRQIASAQAEAARQLAESSIGETDSPSAFTNTQR